MYTISPERKELLTQQHNDIVANFIKENSTLDFEGCCIETFPGVLLALEDFESKMYVDMLDHK